MRTATPIVSLRSAGVIALLLPLLSLTRAGTASASDLFEIVEGSSSIRICTAIDVGGVPELPPGQETCTASDDNFEDGAGLTGEMRVERMGNVWEVPSLDVQLTNDLEIGIFDLSDVSLVFPIDSEAGWPSMLVGILDDDVLRFDGDCDDDTCTGPTPFIVQFDFTVFFQSNSLVLSSDVAFDHTDDGEEARITGAAEVGAIIPLPSPLEDQVLWLSAQITFVPEPSLPLLQGASLATLLVFSCRARRARSRRRLR